MWLLRNVVCVCVCAGSTINRRDEYFPSFHGKLCILAFALSPVFHSVSCLYFALNIFLNRSFGQINEKYKRKRDRKKNKKKKLKTFTSFLALTLSYSFTRINTFVRCCVLLTPPSRQRFVYALRTHNVLCCVYVIFI